MSEPLEKAVMAISCALWRRRAAAAMEADVEGRIGAGRYERSGERTTWRNGHRERGPNTAGLAAAADPEAAAGQLLPAVPGGPKVSEKALIVVIQEAWIGGV